MKQFVGELEKKLREARGVGKQALENPPLFIGEALANAFGDQNRLISQEFSTLVGVQKDILKQLVGISPVIN